MNSTAAPLDDEQDSAYAWKRMTLSVVLSSIGGVGLWSGVVILPAIEAEFGVDRSEASLPYTATLIGTAVGGVLMGRLADRFGIAVPLVISTIMLGLGYMVAASSGSFWQFVLVQAVMIGMFGSSTTFGPLVADISLWFAKHRGIAVAVVASGNYMAGTIWPPILQYLVETSGWRSAYMVVGGICLVTMLPLALMIRRRANLEERERRGTGTLRTIPFGLSTGGLQALLIVAGLACCVAMAMPQVHIVAYCSDLGYGVARGAEMLSLMLGLGVISRLASGLIADRIGGVGTLILGSTLQCLALLFYIPFDGLASLYVVSALFGLAQGGIVPSYAMIIRDYFPAREAGTRISLVMMATVAGMAVGGWMSGEIYDLTGSYLAAFLNGIAWNVLNMAIAFGLLMGRWRMSAVPA